MYAVCLSVIAVQLQHTLFIQRGSDGLHEFDCRIERILPLELGSGEVVSKLPLRAWLLGVVLVRTKTKLLRSQPIPETLHRRTRRLPIGAAGAPARVIVGCGVGQNEN